MKRMFTISAALAIVLAGHASDSIFVTNPTSSAFAAQLTDLSILGIEVTHGIQCFDQSAGYTKAPDNSLDLVFGKPTAVRVYVGHQGASPASGDNAFETVLKNAQVELRWMLLKPNEEPLLLPSVDSTKFNVPRSTVIDVLRQDIRGSANFVIPYYELGVPPGASYPEKKLWLEAEIISPLNEADKSNNVLSNITAVMRATPAPLNVKWSSVHYQPKGYKGSPWADANVAAVSGQLMQTTYPMPVKYSQTSWFPMYDGPLIYMDDQGSSNQLLIHLAYVRQYMEPEPDALIGWLPAAAGYQSGVRGLGTNWGNVAWFVQQSKDEANQVGVAHEIGHTQGVDHVVQWEPAFSTDILEAGFDVASMKVLPGDTDDFMRDNASSGWISPYVWNRLLGESCSPAWSGGCGGSSGASAASALMSDTSGGQSVVLVGGIVRRDGGGELYPVFEYADNGPFPTPSPNGEYALDFQTATGQILSSHRFELDFKHLESGDAETRAGFVFQLPAPASADRIRLRRGRDVIAEQVRTAHPPQLTVDVDVPHRLSPVATISWNASDEDDDPLTYTVLYSPDAGSSLTPLAINTEQTSLQVDTTLLAGGSMAKFRVLASDGFNTSFVDSGIFVVPRKAPNAYILGPGSSAVVNVAERVVLTGHAEDLEDGELLGSSVAWWSDVDGLLGKGSQLILPRNSLSLGRHEIMFVATDNDGMRGTAVAGLYVVIPEPASTLLIGLAGTALTITSRRKRR